MTRDTEQMIRGLAQNAHPVRPLPDPCIRAAIWLALSTCYITVVLLVMPVRHDVSSNLFEPLFIIEQAAALVTGITAAVAAFTTIIPGHNRKWIIVPLAPFAIWLGSLGPGCIQQVKQLGWDVLALQHDLWCFPFIVLLGTIPAAAMAVMLRRGAPLTPHLTAAFGGLAAAGIANLGVRLIHPEDVTVMLLVWHVGCVLVLSALAGSAGHYLLNWRSITRAPATSR